MQAPLAFVRTINMLSTANIQTIFEKCKKKQLFCVCHKDICGFTWIYKQLSVILSYCIT